MHVCGAHNNACVTGSVFYFIFSSTPSSNLEFHLFAISENPGCVNILFQNVLDRLQGNNPFIMNPKMGGELCMLVFESIWLVRLISTETVVCTLARLSLFLFLHCLSFLSIFPSQWVPARLYLLSSSYNTLPSLCTEDVMSIQHKGSYSHKAHISTYTSHHNTITSGAWILENHKNLLTSQSCKKRGRFPYHIKGEAAAPVPASLHLSAVYSNHTKAVSFSAFILLYFSISLFCFSADSDWVSSAPREQSYEPDVLS